MNVRWKATVTAILLGALAAHVALANPAHARDEASQLAQAQGQRLNESKPDQPPSAAARPGMGADTMGGEHGMTDPKMMMQMHGGASSGMMGGAAGGMGQGMMGGMGPMGLCPMMMARTDKDLSAEQVRDILEGHIAWTGNKRLKVGSVKQKDEESYVAEIVTVDDSLVQRVEVNRSTGAMRPID